jgi:hypothetical protein
MTRTRRLALLLPVALTAVLSGACAARSASISELQANPGYYADREVSVTGVVTTAWGIPLVPYKLYRVSDGQAEILVISDNRRTPGKGARVRVRGDVEEFALIGGRSLGLHLRERSLKFL